MARTANRRIKAEEKLTDKASRNIFQTAIYVRISRDKKEKPSDSIENQIALCESYIKKNDGHNLVGIYKDIAKTGTDFERPDFDSLMEEVRMGKVNCIIVKDLSRFGRNYTELGNFIEKIFPFLNIRFIAVNDNFDTFEVDNANKSLEVVLKNIINENYAMDISKKVSSSHQIRIKKGGFICGTAPYGYTAKKDEDGIRRLYVDENTVPIIREIFKAYLNGLSTMDISKMLFEKKMCTAKDYKKYGKAIADEQPIRAWSLTTISQVLRNPVYIGTLVQGKTQKHLYEGKQREWLGEEYWTITENAHEAIISKEDFEKVQTLLSLRSPKSKYSSNSRNKKTAIVKDTIFRGKVYCNICKRKMTVHRQKVGKKSVFYFCCNRFREYSIEKCGTSITEPTLTKTIKAALDNVLTRNEKIYKGYLASYEKVKKEYTAEKEKKLTEIQRKISALSRLQSEYYEKYVLRDLSKEDFEREKSILNQEKEELEKHKEKQIEVFDEEMLNLEGKYKYLQVLLKGKTKKWDKDFVDSIIDKIFIGNDNTVEIQFTFEDTPEFIKKTGGRKKKSILGEESEKV